jgi:hypothetical protein
VLFHGTMFLGDEPEAEGRSDQCQHEGREEAESGGGWHRGDWWDHGWGGK